VADNLIATVERLEVVTAKFERMLYGEPPERPGGLIAEFQALRDDVRKLDADMQRLKSRRTNVWLWIMGYLTFAAGVTFGVVGLLNLIDGHNVLDIPSPVGLWLAAILTMGSLIMFLGGFGWLDRA
jgi:hypothetical protein